MLTLVGTQTSETALTCPVLCWGTSQWLWLGSLVLLSPHAIYLPKKISALPAHPFSFTSSQMMFTFTSSTKSLSPHSQAEF